MEHRMITIALALGALSTVEDQFTRQLARNAILALHQFAGFDYGAVPNEDEFWDWIEEDDEDGEDPVNPESIPASHVSEFGV